MGKSYQYKTKINTYESTPDARMSPVVPLEFFQEAAQRQLEDMDLGLDFLRKNHLAWILVKYEVDYHHYPKAEENVIVETEPLGLNRFEACRRFEVLSEDGERLISGKSIWMLANTETGRPLRINEVEELRSLIDPEDEVFRIGRLQKIETFDNEAVYRVRYFDIDINHHVNNVKYLNWAIESLPLDVVRQYEIKKLRIIYKAQAFYGENVVVKTVSLDDDVWRIDICKEDGQILCEIEITGRRREEPLQLRDHE